MSFTEEHRIAVVHKGVYSANTTYVPLDEVRYEGSSYRCLVESLGNLPTDINYFTLVNEKGEGVPIGGTTGQVLSKTDATDFNTEWTDMGGGVPNGGSSGDIIVKQSTTDGDAAWESKVLATTINGKAGTINLGSTNTTNTGANSQIYGQGAGISLTSGSSVIAQGFNAGSSSTTGSNWMAQGAYAGNSSTTGHGWIAQGRGAGKSNTTGNYWMAQGYNAASNNISGSNWQAQGTYAGKNSTTGTGWMAQGSSAGKSNTTGHGWIAQGYNAGLNNTTGSYWMAQGYNAGRFTSTGNLTVANSTIHIGYNSKSLSDNADNEIVIGANAIGNGSNTATIGGSNVTDTHASGNLHVPGGYCDSSDSKGVAGEVLTSTGTGTTWEVRRGGMHVKDYGATGNGSDDDSAAIQACINAAQLADVPVVFEAGKRYRIESPLVWKAGRKSSESPTVYNVRAKGNGCMIQPIGNMDAFQIVPQCSIADAGTINGAGTGDDLCYIDVSDFRFDGYYSTGGAFIAAGNTDGQIMGFNRQGFHRILMRDAPNTDRGFRFINIQQFAMTECCTILLENEMYADNSGANVGAFTGGINLSSCDFTTNTTNLRQWIIHTGGHNLDQVRGLYFNQCVFYGGNLVMHTNGSGSQVGDVWFTQCAWDVTGSTHIPLQITSSNGGHIFQIYINNVYAVNYPQRFLYCAATDVNSTARMVQVHGCQMNDFSVDGSGMMTFDRVDGLSVIGNTFQNITATSAEAMYDVTNCTDVIVSNNITRGISTVPYGVRFASSSKINCLGNIFNASTAAVSDAGGNTTIWHDNNLQT